MAGLRRGRREAEGQGGRRCRWRGWRWRLGDSGASRLRRRRGCGRECFWGEADAEHPAERAEDAAEPRVGGEEACHLRIGEEVAELRGAGSGLRHQAQQPGLAARQRRLAGLPRPGRALRREAGGSGRGHGGTGEAGGDAAQPRPEQDDKRAGKSSEAQASRDGLAQPLDDEGEAVGQGKRGGLRHEQNKTIPRGGWASGICERRLKTAPGFIFTGRPVLSCGRTRGGVR
jgi:hypothetical protein